MYSTPPLVSRNDSTCLKNHGFQKLPIELTCWRTKRLHMLHTKYKAFVIRKYCTEWLQLNEILQIWCWGNFQWYLLMQLLSFLCKITLQWWHLQVKVLFCCEITIPGNNLWQIFACNFDKKWVNCYTTAGNLLVNLFCEQLLLGPLYMPVPVFSATISQL